MKKHGLSRKPKFIEENYFRESKKLENGRGEAGRDTEMGSLVEQDMHFHLQWEWVCCLMVLHFDRISILLSLSFFIIYS